METEKEKLEREIKVLEEASKILGGGTTVLTPAIAIKRRRFESLTATQIKDGVLGRWVDKDETLSTGIQPYDHKIRPTNITFHPLTIEELLPTLAQWVPGAVRWRYMCRDRVEIYDDMVWRGEIPAPYREDWSEIGGEL